MAATSTGKKKTTTKKSTSAKTPSKSASTARSSAKTASKTPAKRPVRREVWALVCFFFAIFTFIGCFKIEALFITYVCGFLKGLIGYGYYLFPFALLGCAFILMFHHGRPVKARTICMLCLPIALGALAHLLLSKLELEGVKVTELLPILYENGREMRCGGLICGFLAVAFRKVFSIYGAIPVFFFAALALAMAAARLTPAKVVELWKQHAARRLEYEPEPEPMPVSRPTAAMRQQAANTAVFPASRRKYHAIDIQVDDEPVGEYEERMEGGFNKNPRVKTPDQLLQKYKDADAAKAERLLGWKAEKSLDDMCRDSWNWTKKSIGS